MKIYIKIFFLTLLTSCSSSAIVTIPDDVLHEEKMADVMVDVHLLEAALNISTYNKDRVTVGTINPTSDILKKNHITKKQFDESFDFYSRNPQLLGQVYDLVLNDLSKMQAQVMNKK